MKNKILLLVFGMIFLIGIVTAGNIVTWNWNTSPETEAIILNVDEGNFVKSEITCDDDYCWQSLRKGDYGLGEVQIRRYTCTDWSYYWDNSSGENILVTGVCIGRKDLKNDKIIEELNKQMEKKLEEIAKTIKKREEGLVKLQ